MSGGLLDYWLLSVGVFVVLLRQKYEAAEEAFTGGVFCMTDVWNDDDCYFSGGILVQVLASPGVECIVK